ncbi:MAG: DUF1570 domain-containing protein [Phycisphaerae bacterium]
MSVVSRGARRRTPIRFTVLVLWALVGCTSPGPRQAGAFTTTPWIEDGLTGRRLVTEHFDIWSTLGDVEFELALPSFLEFAYRRYTELVPPLPDAGPRLNVYVLGTASEWAHFVTVHQPPGVEIHALVRVDGFTHGGLSACHYTDRATTLAALAHECWHQYVNACSTSPIPAWLDEGLGCSFETLQITGGVRNFGPEHNTIRLNGLRKAIAEQRLLPLKQLVNSDATTVSRYYNTDLTQTYYAQVWALVTYLRHGADRKHAKSFDRLLEEIAAGRFMARVSAFKLHEPGAGDLTFGEAVLAAYFGASPDRLHEDYIRYLVDIAE